MSPEKKISPRLTLREIIEGHFGANNTLTSPVYARKCLDETDYLIGLAVPENLTLRYANRKFIDTFNLDPNKLNVLKDFIPPSQLAESRTTLEKISPDNPNIDMTMEIRGRIYHWKVITIFKDNLIDHFILSGQDVTERQQLEEKLLKEAQTDPLTQLYNLRYLAEHYQQYSKYPDIRSLLAVMFDVDNFKDINDTLGHKHGDQVLVEVANTIKSLSRHSNDIVGRIGGDEFFAFYPNFDHQPQLIDDFLGRFTQAFNRLGYGVSLGSVCLDKAQLSEFSFEKTKDLADRSMYQMKNSKRNTL